MVAVRLDLVNMRKKRKRVQIHPSTSFLFDQEFDDVKRDESDLRRATDAINTILVD